MSPRSLICRGATATSFARWTLPADPIAICRGERCNQNYSFSELRRCPYKGQLASLHRGRSSCCWLSSCGTRRRFSNRSSRWSVVAVGDAHGAELQADYAERRLALADDVSPDMRSSMHHDLQRGRPPEIRWMSGGVVQLGSAVGIATPRNRAIADVFALYEADAPAPFETRSRESSGAA
jgi:hypothetical protein